ncbi:WW domain-containing oxidoreductase [Xylogone sp. PMI_703]|nr:WW domain-containing oxidoreductase [Xylogone sp. PMI_703]
MATKSRYAEAYANRAGPGDSRPTAIQIIEDEGLKGKLVGKVFFITGCSSGSGVEAARAIAATGAQLYVTARDVSKAQAALKDVLETGRLEILHMDQSSLQSVREAAAKFLTMSKQLNVLICNAGVMAIPTRQVTADGFEMHLGVNHLSHFLLFHLLRDTLLSSATKDFPSRVVTVSSSGHRMSRVQFDDLNLEKEYNPWTAYGHTKTANIYMANEIERRYGSQGLHGLSLMPGNFTSPLQRHQPDLEKNAIAQDSRVVDLLMSVEQGAATTVVAAVSPDFNNVGGVYLDECEIATPFKGDFQHDSGYAEHAYDPAAEARLWEESVKLLGL